MSCMAPRICFFFSLGYGNCPYVVRDVIHVRDVSLFSVVMKGLTEVEGDYVDCMDWTKEGTPYNLQVILLVQHYNLH